MKSILISTAIILAIGLGGAWAERVFSGFLHAASVRLQAVSAPV